MSRLRALSRASNQTKSKDPGASTSSQSNGQASFQNIAPINNQVEIRNQSSDNGIIINNELQGNL
jgi:hypothetical protein